MLICVAYLCSYVGSALESKTPGSNQPACLGALLCGQPRKLVRAQHSCPTLTNAPLMRTLLANRGDVGFANSTATSERELERAEAAALEDNKKFNESIADLEQIEVRRSQSNGARVCKGGPVRCQALLIMSALQVLSRLQKVGGK